MAKRKNEQEAHLWERQKGESEQAWQAFTIYLRQEKRNLKAVAEELHKSYTLIRRWKSTWFWEDRVIAYDNEIQRDALEKAKKAQKKMYSNYAGVAQRLMILAAEIIDAKRDNMDPEKVSIKDVCEMVRTAMGIEEPSRSALILLNENAAEATEAEDVVVIVPDDGLNGGGEND